MIERKALIFNIQKYNMYDGPGVRTIVFFKGCPLRCRWCSNPESQGRGYELLYKHNQCINCGACVGVCPAGVHGMVDGAHRIDRTARCIGCQRCVEVCKGSALTVAGEQKTISELLAVIEEDRPFYEVSGGGVTLGGGEALMQPEAAAGLLMACTQKGIDTAMETCGYALPAALERVAPHTNLFLFDMKHMDSQKHYEGTGVRNESILNNLTWLLENRFNVQIRVPMLKDYNDDPENMSMMVRFLKPYSKQKNLKGIDVLPYHKMGVHKYTQLDREYPLPGDPRMDEPSLERAVRILDELEIPVTILRH